MLLALRANPGYLDDRVIDREADVIGLRQQAWIAMLDLGDLLAITANEELGGTLVTRVYATDKGIAAFDAMDQPLRQQEFERTVHDRRGNALGVIGTVQQGEDIVGAQRLVASQQDFEHLVAARRQPQVSLLANAARRRQQFTLAAAVVVLAKRNIRIVWFTRHCVIL